MNKELILKGVRLSFPELTKPKSVAGGKPRFGATLIIDPKTPEGKIALEQVQAALKEIAKEEFKGIIPEGKDCCLRKGDTQLDKKTDEPYNGFAGNMILSANRAEVQGPPLVVKGKTPLEQRDPLYPCSGDYVNAKVQIFSLNGKNDKGGNAAYGKKMCCQLEVIQAVRKGESLGGARPATADGMPDEEPEAEDDGLN